MKYFVKFIFRLVWNCGFSSQNRFPIADPVRLCCLSLQVNDFRLYVCCRSLLCVVLSRAPVTQLILQSPTALNLFLFFLHAIHPLNLLTLCLPFFPCKILEIFNLFFKQVSCFCKYRTTRLKVINEAAFSPS